MRLRPHRRNLVVWRQSAGPAGRYATPRSARHRRTSTRRVRRVVRTGALLTVIAVRVHWWPLLGVALTAAGVMLRGGPAGVILLPGLLFLLSAPLVPAGSRANRRRLSELERELAAYWTPADRCDLEAILDRYPDGATRELRDILARQTLRAPGGRPPG